MSNQQLEALRAEFEEWWMREGARLRPGSSDHDKSFAARAFQAARVAQRAGEAVAAEEVVSLVHAHRAAVQRDEGVLRNRETFDAMRKAESDLIAAIRSLAASPAPATDGLPELLEQAEVLKDAARYRWIKENADVSFHYHQWFYTKTGHRINSTSPTPDEMDGAIDAAIAAAHSTTHKQHKV